MQKSTVRILFTVFIFVMICSLLWKITQSDEDLRILTYSPARTTRFENSIRNIKLHEKPEAPIYNLVRSFLRNIMYYEKKTSTLFIRYVMFYSFLRVRNSCRTFGIHVGWRHRRCSPRLVCGVCPTSSSLVSPSAAHRIRSRNWSSFLS